MNIFGSSGPSPEEFQRESIIKSQITTNLKEAIKTLQRTHIDSEEPIRSSEDTANAVCNVLEAVFLHGLRASVTKKLTYLTGYSSNCDCLSFWGLLQCVTHKNTLHQLTQLKQITSEIGLCRAWLRLALNDAVLESYLNAIINDVNTLRHYYKKTAYLRDAEQPGILMQYTQSLNHFQFELAYNASVLNIWTRTPLILAGIITPELDPRPVVARAQHSSPTRRIQSHASPIIKQVFSTNSSSQPSPHHHADTSSQRYNTAETNHVLDSDELICGPVTPPNTPHDPSQLTKVDIEAIRNMTCALGSASSSTGTSQISQPDPVDARQLVPDLTPLQVYPLPVASEANDTLVTQTLSSTKTALPPNTVKTGTQLPTTNDVLASSNCSKTSLQNNSQDQIQVESSLDCLSDNIITEPDANYKRQQAYEDTLSPFCEQNYDDTLNPFAGDDNQSAESHNSELLACRDSAKSSKQVVGGDYYNDELNPFHCETDKQQDFESLDETNPFHANFNHNKSKHSHHSDQNNKERTSINHKTSSVNAAPAKNSSSVTADIRTQHALTNDQSRVASLSPALKDDTSTSNISYQKLDICGRTAEGSSSGCRINEDKENTETTSEMEISHSSQPAAIKANSSSHSMTKGLSQSSSFPKFDVGKSPPLEPMLSTAMATSESVELAKEAISGLSSSLADSLSLSLEDNSDYQPKGNSLRLMEGWSSDFDTSLRLDQENAFTMSGQHGQSESFDNMLQNYGCTVNQLEVHTLSEVIDGLPPLEVDSFYGQQSSMNTLQKVPSPGDEVVAEYEVLPDLMEKRAYLSDPKYQPLVCLLSTIATEKGLDVQNYQCKGCSRPVGMFYGKARVCGYDASYYCFECHENDEAYIPARIIYNWDFRKQKVCHKNHRFLQQCEDDPLLDIQVLNPKLYIHVPEMSEVKDLRIQLRYLKSYLFTCKQSVADELRKQIWPRDYYYEDIHRYSLYDLLQVASGKLAGTLSALVKSASKHVYECGLCSQKGFICEICSNPKVIYAFEINQTVQCERCHAVYHKDCKESVKMCPKCERRMKFHQHHGSIAQTSRSLSDYSFSLDTSTSDTTQSV